MKKTIITLVLTIILGITYAQDFKKPRTVRIDSIIGKEVQEYRIWKYEACYPRAGSGLEIIGFMQNVIIKKGDTIGNRTKSFTETKYYSDTLVIGEVKYPISDAPKHFNNTELKNINGLEMMDKYVNGIIEARKDLWTF